MRRPFAPISLLLLLFSGTVFAQAPSSQATPAEPLPAFDLADVHPNRQVLTLLTALNGGNRGAVLRTSGRYEFMNATMVDLIRTAYNVDADKVLSGPRWLETDRFDIIAQAPPKTSPDTARLMLQALLADRFKLVLHKDLHPLPTYSLSVAKGGHKLKASDGSGEPGCTMNRQQASQGQIAAARVGDGLVLLTATFVYTCQNMTMAAFAEQLHTMQIAQVYIGNNPTVDQTGLKGAWDFNFKYTQKPPTANPTVTTANGTVAVTIAGDSITLFDAVDKQLGLKLDPITAPIPVLIVDSVNRKPTDNPPEVTAKLPPPPKGEFDVAELRLTAPGGPPNVSQRTLPNGQVDMRNYPLKTLINRAFSLNAQAELVGAPKWLDTARVDLIARLPPSGMLPPSGLATPAIDQDALTAAIRALLIERFKVAIHTEMRPGTGWALTASKPKLEKADPINRTLCKEGPGPNGKDPRTANPVLGRLVTCQNMTMAEFAEQLPLRASGYFRVGDEVVDATGLTDAYDFTLSFSAAGLVPGANNGAVLRGIGDGVAAPGAPAAASDPNGALSLLDALTKQLGLKLEQQKRPVPTAILDHIEEKPTE
jgi:uncharacterized protein (TIGR03435 family)